MSTTRRDSNQDGSGGPKGAGELPPAAAADSPKAGEQGVRPLAATFRRILQVVFLIFVVAVMQMFMLWGVCNSGMKTAASLQHQGLPVLDDLALLQENLAICRLGSYEYLFAREDEKAEKAAKMDAVAALARSELEHIKQLLPEGDGKRLAFELEAAMNDLDAEFRIVREHVDADFAVGMAEMDQVIPPKKTRVNDAAKALKNYVSDFSGKQAKETFGSFGWIKNNAILFGAGNILVAFGAVMFVLLAARRSRAQLSDTLARLDQRTQELAGSLSLIHATLEATADGLVLIDTSGGIGNFNQQFAGMWRVSQPAQTLQDKQRFLAHALPLVERSEKLAGRMDELAAHPERESSDVLELKDGRVFECCSKPQRIHDRICGRVWSFRDITERRRAEESLASEQRLLNNLITATPDIVYFKDRDSRFIRVNQGYARRNGYSDPSAAEGKTDFDVFGQEHASQAYADEQRIIATGEPMIDKEEREDWKDGRVTWVSSTKMPLLDAAGKIIGIMGISRDITERKRAEESLRLLGSAVEQAVDAIEITDGQLDLPGPRILFVNPAFTKLTGYTAKEVVGKTPRILYGEHTDKAELARMWATLARGDAFHGETVNYRKDGAEFHSELHVAPIRDAKGVITHFVAIKRDITERRRAEEALVSEQRLLNNLITALPDIVYFKDRESRFIRINNSFVHKHGLADASAALGKTDFELFGNEHAGEAYADEQRIITTGQPLIEKEEREDWKDGHVTWVSTTKMPLRDDDGKIVGIMGVSRDITERKRSEESLRLLGSSVEQAEDSIHITDAQLDLPGPRILFVNPAFTKMTGYTAQEVLGKTPRILQGERTDKAVLARLRAALGRGEAFHGEVVNYRKDGLEFLAEIHIAPIRDANGVLTHFVAIKRDITERRRFEERLFQSQKMETVGKLAGGIAHEFNSIMTAILGQSELMLYDLAEGNPLRKSVIEIHRAADRAAILTRQLLAYGRKQILKPDVLDLNTVLAGMENTLRHLAGRDVDVHIAPPTGPKLVKADAGQIEQVIVNIVMNAADAMPHGGKLTLEIADVFLDQDYVSRFPDLKTGDYAMLAITDTGAGMSDAVKARIFEPFFTTKEVGKGTGLGLATCHGIIKQSDGHINVYSEPGRGATFKIYLPKVQLEAKPPGPPLKTPGLAHGTETILLVEDDPALREMAATLLGRLGYTVLTAGNGLEALNVTHQRSTGHIDLLFTDVVMPHMSGKELADRVKALYPRTKILFTSAYTENAFVHQGVLDPGITLLQKPFTPSSLASKVREVLDRDTTAAAV